MKDAATSGVAILAGAGAGLLSDAKAGFAAWRGQENRLNPKPEHQQALDEAYARYQALARMLFK